MPLLFRCCVMHGRTVRSNAMANQSRTTLYLALACQSFARPLRFIELRFHELHFLCMTPPTCALLCLYLSLRVKTSPHLCLSKLSLASPLPIKTVLCIPSLCESMSINAVPLLIDARPLLCCSNQHLRTSQSFTGSLCRSQCYS